MIEELHNSALVHSVQVEGLEETLILQNLLVHDVKIPEDVFEKIERAHVTAFMKNEERFQEDLPSHIEKARHAIENGIADGLIQCDIKRIDTRLRETQFELIDPIESFFGENEARYGLLSNTWIDMAQEIPEADKKRVFLHHLLHIVSGRTAIADKDNFDESNESSMEVGHLRSGLRFSRDRDESAVHGSQTVPEKPEEIPRFEWLNEAVTERLAMRLRETSTGTHEKERQLFELLLTKGKQPVDEQIFFNAYFEDVNPADFERLRAWKKLAKEIADSYEPGFLVKIDNIVREKGRSKAIQYLEGFEKK